MRDAAPTFDAIEGLDEDARQGTYFTVIHPTCQLVMAQDCMWWLNVTPLAHDRSLLEVGGCFPANVLEDPDFESKAAPYYERWEAVAREDVDILERQQRALGSVLYRPGPAVVARRRGAGDRHLGARPPSGHRALTTGEAAASVGGMRAANRDELSPLLFLDRVRRVYAGRTAVVDGDRRTYGEFGERGDRLAAALARAGVGPATAWPTAAQRARAARGALRVPGDRRGHGADQLALVGGRGALHPRALGGRAPARPRPELPSSATSRGAAVAASWRSGEPEELLATPRSRRLPRCARGRAQRSLDQLHLRHDRRPKGVMVTHRGAYLNALRRVRAVGRLTPLDALPLDAADVPLQRLVLPLGRDGGRRRPTSACPVDPAEVWRADPAGAA